MAAAFPSAAQNLRNIPYTDPVYLFLDKGYAKGWIGYLPLSRPYSEKRVIEYLSIIESSYKTSPEKFSDPEITELYSHKNRIEGERYSFIRSEEGKFSGEINMSPHISASTAAGRISDTDAVTGSELSIDLYAGDKLYMGLSADSYAEIETWDKEPYRKFNSPLKPDFNMYTFNLDNGDQGFNHEAIHSEGDTEISLRMNQLNQTTIDAGLIMLSFGRNSLSWGPSRFANLSLSSTSKPYEYLTFDIPVGENMYFTWMTGFLRQTNELQEEGGSKIISGHRFEYQMTDWFMFSFYETVVYTDRFELAYVNPFSLYHISEVTQGDLDNKMGGFDFLFRFASSNLYLSLFVDDWDLGQILNPSFFHNEMGVTLGYRSYALLSGLTLTLEYTYLDHWVYSHKTVNGDNNNYTNYGSNLGHLLQPNSQMICLDLRFDADIRKTFGLSFWFTQHGYGDVYTHASDEGVGWDMDGLYDEGVKNYSFLDIGVDGAVLETNVDATLYTEYRIPFYGISLYASYSIEYTGNENLVKGENSWDHILTVSGKWKAY